MLGIGISTSALAVSNVTTPVVGSSPFLYRNTSNVAQQILIAGGTTSLIQYSKDNVTFYPSGLLSGSIILLPGDYVKVTYVVAPTMTTSDLFK